MAHGDVSVELELAQCARDYVELAAYVVDGTSDGRWSVNHRHSLRVRVIGQLERTRYRTREFSTAMIRSMLCLEFPTEGHHFVKLAFYHSRLISIYRT